MVVQFGLYQAVVAPASSACLAGLRRNGTAPEWAPAGMLRWVSPSKSEWCYTSAPGKFDAPFLIQWGARWAPKMRSK